ncbi:hypothetical protein LINPERHAP1_LOCUS32058 [Linum perenne]
MCLNNHRGGNDESTSLTVIDKFIEICNNDITGCRLGLLKKRPITVKIRRELIAILLLSSSAIPEHQQAAEVINFQNLCRRDWRVTIRHIFREANEAADFLASQGYDFPFGTHLFPLSDCNLGRILRY